MEGNWPVTWPDVMDLADDVYVFDPDGDVLIQLQKADCAQQSEDESTSDASLNVYLRVSSRHLILASPVFKAMLEINKFAEGKTLQSQKNLSLQLPDDPEASIILMYIIHGTPRNVPRDVTMNTIIKLAKLVDYYQLHESVQIFSDTWIANLRKKRTLPQSYNNEVVPWLFISWVFHMREEFEAMTRILVCECNDTILDSIDLERFPIPFEVHNRIQDLRNAAIERIISLVHGYISKYMTSHTICSGYKPYDCDSKVLGSLLKSSVNIGIWPRPVAPYEGIKFSMLAVRVRGMEILDKCDNYRGGGHDIKGKIDASIRSLEDLFRGSKSNSFAETQNKR